MVTFLIISDHCFIVFSFLILGEVNENLSHPHFFLLMFHHLRHLLNSPNAIITSFEFIVKFYHISNTNSMKLYKLFKFYFSYQYFFVIFLSFLLILYHTALLKFSITRILLPVFYVFYKSFLPKYSAYL